MDSNYLEKFDLKDLIDYLKQNPEYINIALQFDTENLNKSILFYDFLKSEFPQRFVFVTGETSYTICCADEAAAKHLNADVIVRIGASCVSETKTMPVYYLLESIEFDVDSLITKLEQIDLKNITKLVIFYDDSLTKAFHNYKNQNQQIHIAKTKFRPDLHIEDNSLELYSKFINNILLFR